jgi:protein TonB
MMIMTGSAIKSQAPIGKPLNHTFFENELNGPGAHPRPKVLMDGPPGGQGISASTVGLIRRTQPVYPQLAKKSGWQGTVVIRVVVQTNGMPGEAQIRKSSGHDILDKAAIEAIRSWRFSPAKDGNIPIRSAVDIPINFKLHG